MGYKVFDETVLQEEADFKLELDISSGYPHKNPDGTNPVLTLEVKAASKLAALNYLSILGENDGSALLEVLVTYAAVKAGLADVDMDILEVVNDERFQQVFKDDSEFFEIPLSATLDMESGEAVEVISTITAPSFVTAFKGVKSLTSKKRLNSLMASFMPDDDEYYDDF